ncbi:MAG: ribosomal-processing cysteine protease Prp [Clostridia bacterium]|nr:ribosomal-processing cysteine protease Prp [Clostridia bacterium]
MIRVLVERDEAGELTLLEVEGHAGFAPRGRDIVCAAVSALVGTAVLGLERVGAPFELEEREGFTRIRLGPGAADLDARRRAADLLEAVVLGLRAIEADYGQHVEVAVRGGERHAEVAVRSPAVRAQEGRRQHPQRAR